MSIVLFQKEIAPTVNYTPTRTAFVLTSEKPDAIQKEAVSKLEFGFKAWLVKFKELPPAHMLLAACEERVRDGECYILPALNAPKPSKSKKVFIQRYRQPKVDLT